MRNSFIVIALLLLAATDAAAYECARANTGGSSSSSLSWFMREIPFTLYARGTHDIDGDAEFDVLRDAFSAWSRLNVPGGIATCDMSATTDLTFRETAISTTDRVGYDFLNPELSENLLIFRDSDWDSADANVIALTTTTYDAVSGEILDADIEFNSTNFDFVTSGTAGMDLANTATHEIGHFLGLAHTQPENTEATMYARAVQGETKKRDLACDDAEAIVFKYPAAEANGYCTPATDACGHCAPPRSATETPIVTVTDKSADGALQSGCSATSASPWAFMLVIALRRRARASRER